MVIWPSGHSFTNACALILERSQGIQGNLEEESPKEW